MKRSLAAAMYFALGLPASAAGAQTPETISIQLNTAETTGAACRLTFVIRNQLQTPLDALGLDLVMFDQTEGVSGYAAVDFGSMPPGKTVVRRFDGGSAAGADISRVLLNEVRDCKSQHGPLQDCLTKLLITSRSEIDFIL